MDALIAAIALETGETLLTGNTREFRRVGDLHVETY